MSVLKLGSIAWNMLSIPTEYISLRIVLFYYKTRFRYTRVHACTGIRLLVRIQMRTYTHTDAYAYILYRCVRSTMYTDNGLGVASYTNGMKSNLGIVELISQISHFRKEAESSDELPQLKAKQSVVFGCISTT